MEHTTGSSDGCWPGSKEGKELSKHPLASQIPSGRPQGPVPTRINLRTNYLCENTKGSAINSTLTE